MGILDDFEQGINAFSPFAMRSEKQFARAAAPALAGALGNIRSNVIRGDTDIMQEQIRGKYGYASTGLRDVGETLRQNIMSQAQRDITGMQQEGANWREKYGQDSATGRTRITDEGESYRQKKRLRAQSDLLDQDLINNTKLYQTFGLNNSGRGRDPGAVLNEIEGGGDISNQTTAAPAGMTTRRMPGILDRALRDEENNKGYWWQ